MTNNIEEARKIANEWTTPEHFTDLSEEIAAALAAAEERGRCASKPAGVGVETPPLSTHVVGSKCQYSEDVGMPEYRCAIRCQYDVDADALVSTERKRCLDIVDEYYGGGRSYLMRKIAALAAEGQP